MCNLQYLGIHKYITQNQSPTFLDGTSTSFLKEIKTKELPSFVFFCGRSPPINQSSSFLYLYFHVPFLLSSFLLPIIASLLPIIPWLLLIFGVYHRVDSIFKANTTHFCSSIIRQQMFYIWRWQLAHSIHSDLVPKVNTCSLHFLSSHVPFLLCLIERFFQTPKAIP